ncbi:MAG: helix-turn-helix transcriptional regulator [Chromatiaceae bacterium]|nr:helix-turn-helix transcriptional regulator [Gammaproteobacteria bacterium]MCP5316516.1 helix-turn-helix transcriptional regulator [Chromatiaceae bacterium]MCP5434177.1 helix-turn-helix transcriptional regulator [Chromatiaceae bacterium]HPQ24693.1 helix-turn-helix transcriptional regulator [Gammaproteobacteria bacterium]
MAIRNRKDLGAAVRRARRAKKLSQTDLARMASVRQPLISALENGTTSVTIDTLLKVLAPLALDLDLSPRRSASFDPTEY